MCCRICSCWGGTPIPIGDCSDKERSPPKAPPACRFCCFAFGTYGAAPRAKATPEGTYGGAFALPIALVALDVRRFGGFPFRELLTCKLPGTNGCAFRLEGRLPSVVNVVPERVSEVPLLSDSKEPPTMSRDADVLGLLTSITEVMIELLPF